MSDTLEQLEKDSLAVAAETGYKKNTSSRIGRLFYRILQFLRNLYGGTYLLGDKENEAAIKAVANPSRGDTYRALDTGHYWTFNGSTWSDIGIIIPTDIPTRNDVKQKAENITFQFLTQGLQAISITENNTKIAFAKPRLFLPNGSFSEKSETIEFEYENVSPSFYYIKATYIKYGDDGLLLEIVKGQFWIDEQSFDNKTFVMCFKDGKGWNSRYATVQTELLIAQRNLATINDVKVKAENVTFQFLTQGLQAIQISTDNTQISFKYPRIYKANGLFSESNTTYDFEAPIATGKFYYIKATFVKSGADGIKLELVEGKFWEAEPNFTNNEYVLCYRDERFWQSKYVSVQEELTRAKASKEFFEKQVFLSADQDIVIKDKKITFPKTLRVLWEGYWQEISQAVSLNITSENGFVIAKRVKLSGKDSIVLEYREGYRPYLTTPGLESDEYLIAFASDGGLWQSDYAEIQSALTRVYLLNGQEMSEKKGRDADSSPYYFNKNSPSGIAYNIGSESSKDGVIDSMTFFATELGEVHFANGIVDQWGKAIKSPTYTLVADKVGYQTHQTNIEIKKGEIPFVILTTKVIGYISNAGGADKNTLSYNDQDENGIMKPFAGANGGFLNMSYTIKFKTDNISSVKEETKNNTTSIARLQSRVDEVSQSSYTTDEITGEKYQIVVRDRQLSLRSTIIRKVLVLGNSTTQHPITTFWWHDGAMASTEKSKGWTQLLQKRLQTRDIGATVTAYNIVDWENIKAAWNNSLLDPYLVSDLDLVIIRIGENGPSADFENRFRDLVDYIASKVPDTRIIIAGMQMFANQVKDDAMKLIAQEKGYSFIDLSYQNSNPQYQNTLDTLILGNDGIWHRIGDGVPESIVEGVRKHPSDKAYREETEDICVSIGY